MSRTGASARPGSRSHSPPRPGSPRRRGRGPAIVVRPATPDDVIAVTELRTALRSETGPPRAPANPQEGIEARAHALTEAQLAAAHRHPRRQVLLVAEHESRVVGLLRCVAARSSSFALPGRYALVTTVFVRPSHRRRGVLRSLLRAADAWARAIRLREMRLHCAVRNQVGHAAWAALGFTPVEILHRRVVPPESPAR